MSTRLNYKLKKRFIGELLPPQKDINEILKDLIKLDAPFQHFSTVIISKPNERIRSIGVSRRNNLILDQFGKILALILATAGNAQREDTITDTGNTGRLLQAWADQTPNDYTMFYNGTVLGGAMMQVGAGTTAALRTDYNIETAFGTAPEDAPFATGLGSYAAGAIGIAGAISAGGNGTIAETLLILQACLNTGAATTYVFALFHDLLVSTEAFVAAETITTTYTINL